ncbi:hypothetical protein PS732_03521 [Pseudomonas fluorescens]|uniref:Uncharacterized protein n=1 Tax=Pseudomonas fluorescens TaxID=294 RepID=A0ABD7VIS7_PSEFL|nr:hypothetical protein PS732_03521 [Pseudomonas fluorescens]
MIAGETEVVGEHMTIEFFAELSTEGAAACTSSEPAEDGARDCAEGDAKRAGNSADSSAHLACCQSGGRTTSGSADGSNSCANLHGCL